MLLGDCVGRRLANRARYFACSYFAELQSCLHLCLLENKSVEKAYLPLPCVVLGGLYEEEGRKPPKLVCGLTTTIKTSLLEK